MRSTFYGLDIVNKGLFVAQRQIDVTGHNISNANTVGYSRQRFVTSAVPPPGSRQQFAPVTKGQVGAGVETMSLDQIRDRFLDRQLRHEQTKANYWQTKSNALYYIEDVFNGEHDTSLVGIMGSFFNAVQELTKNPTDEAIRTNMIQEARKSTNTQSEELLFYTPVECILIQLCHYGQHFLSPKHTPNGELSLSNFTRFCALVKNLAPLSNAFHTDSFNFQ